MRYIDDCYFCSTPYQIIAAVSIARENHETADLYVFFDGAEDWVNEIRKENIFSNVVLLRRICKKYKYHILTLFNVLKSYLQCSKIAQEILLPDTRYDKFYFSSQILEVKCCFFHYIKKGFPVKRVLIDDGIGSYINDRFNHISRKDTIVRRLLFGQSSVQPVSDKMLFSPNLYTTTSKSVKYKITKINGHFNDEETTKLFNKIFHFEDSDLIKENCILMDCIHNEILDKRGQKRLDQIYQKIFETYGTVNIIVKPHPRDNAALKNNIKYYMDYKLPLECMYMNTNCSNKVIISVASTAVATPKILFDQEPYIILLYKLLDLKNKNINQKDLDIFFTSFRKLYVHPERFMIPESVDEMVEYLNQLKKLFPN